MYVSPIPVSHPFAFGDAMALQPPPRVLLAGLLVILPFSACQCIEEIGFSGIPDAGVDAGPPPAPPPPRYPLKSGDQLILNGVGGRTQPCDVEGGCERTLRASYTVDDVYLDELSNTWTISADFSYEMTVSRIEAGVMSQLFISNVAPYEDIDQGGVLNGAADFDANAAPTDALTANGFPFFHFEPEYATREDSAYRSAALAFQNRILELDPDAEIENQAADAKFEAYFKDSLGVSPMLHKVRVDLHPFGFVCAWDERLIPWTEGMPRNEGAFASGSGIPLAAVFPGQVQLVREDTRYLCSCFTKQCRASNDQQTCLDPADPDAAPKPCACLGSMPPDTCP